METPEEIQAVKNTREEMIWFCEDITRTKGDWFERKDSPELMGERSRVNNCYLCGVFNCGESCLLTSCGKGSVYSPWGNRDNSPEVRLEAAQNIVNLCDDWLKKYGKPVPDPKFKVGDKVVACNLAAHRTVVRVIPKHEHKIKRDGVYWKYGLSIGGAIYSEARLTLAPVEEWVDVTEECGLDLYSHEGTIGRCGWVRHGLVTVLYVGSKFYIPPTDKYKVELIDSSYAGAGSFKILKRTDK